MRKGLMLCLWTILLLISPVFLTNAGFELPRTLEKIAYYSLEGNQRGLWLYDPASTDRELVLADISDQYQFSPDGRYLAFLANNQDRGVGQSNTVSLWVRDLTNGIEQAIVSDFDTDSNIDAKYQWMKNGDLAVVQMAENSERKFTLYNPDGTVTWAVPVDYQYIANSADRILMRNRTEQSLCFYNSLSKQIVQLPDRGMIVNASISPQGNYLCYQTLKEITLLNIKKNERVYIDVGEMNGIEYGWSAEESFLVFQARKQMGEEEFYQLAVFNVVTGMKEFEVNSSEPVTYSWSTDAKQMVFSMYRNGWNVMIWFPEQYNTRSVRTGLKEQPVPRYQQYTHQFIFLDSTEGKPRIYNYDVDTNLMRLVHSEDAQSIWQNIQWVPKCTYEVKRPLHKLYKAGSGEVKRIQFVRHLSADDDFHKILKWAPTHRTLLLKEDAQTLALIDDTGKVWQIYTGTKVGEPFWSTDGSHLGFIVESDPRELVLYNVFRGQATKYPLLQSQYELVQWMEGELWLYDGQLTQFYPLSNEWEGVNEWKDFWWDTPEVLPAHFRNESLWQLGANLWLRDWEGQFKVLTRLPVNLSEEGQVLANRSGRWAPDDEQILYERRFRNGKEDRSEIWAMDWQGRSQRFLCEGEQPEWYGNHRFLFLKDGNLHLASIGSAQIITLDTPELTELAYMVSYDGALVAVVARDRQEKVGLYLYEVQ